MLHSPQNQKNRFARLRRYFLLLRNQDRLTGASTLSTLLAPPLALALMLTLAAPQSHAQTATVDLTSYKVSLYPQLKSHCESEFNIATNDSRQKSPQNAASAQPQSSASAQKPLSRRELARLCMARFKRIEAKPELWDQILEHCATPARRTHDAFTRHRPKSEDLTRVHEITLHEQIEIFHKCADEKDEPMPARLHEPGRASPSVGS